MLQLYLVPDLAQGPTARRLGGPVQRGSAGVPGGARVGAGPAAACHGEADSSTQLLALPTRRALVAKVGAETGRVPAFTMPVGSPRPYGAAAIADVADGSGPVDVLIERARQQITAVSGPAGGPGGLGVSAHLTLAYANGEQDSEPVQRALRRHAGPAMVLMTVAEVELVEVEKDPQQCVYRWTKGRGHFRLHVSGMYRLSWVARVRGMPAWVDKYLAEEQRRREFLEIKMIAVGLYSTTPCSRGTQSGSRLSMSVLDSVQQLL